MGGSYYEIVIHPEVSGASTWRRAAVVDGHGLQAIQ
jgi:hypothetical protein